MSIVTKYNGKTAERENCRLIKGKYYEKNIDCFRIDGLWRGVDNGIMYKDLDKVNPTYVLKKHYEESIRTSSNKIREYVIGTSRSGAPLIGFSSGIPFNVVEVFDDETQSIERVRANQFDASKYKRNENSGIFYKSEEGKAVAASNTGMLYRREIYNFDKIQGFYREAEFSFPKIRESKYSFGIEIETEGGKIPVSELTSVGLFPLKDGSIKGFEYTSVPFNDYGHAAHIGRIVSKYCKIGINNSYHVHIGGLDVNEEQVVCMYETISQLQNEIYKMFPKYKKVRSEIKRRDYSSPLPNIKHNTIEKYFNELMQFFTGGNMGRQSYVDSKGKVLKHPQDPNGDHKWNIESRYRIFNLIPMIFSEGRTIESRIHEETTNPYKIVYWIMINEAIVDYAQRNSFENIIGNKATLKEVITSYFTKRESEALLSYIEERKELYKDIDKNDAGFYSKLANEDKKYVPKIKLF